MSRCFHLTLHLYTGPLMHDVWTTQGRYLLQNHSVVSLTGASVFDVYGGEAAKAYTDTCGFNGRPRTQPARTHARSEDVSLLCSRDPGGGLPATSAHLSAQGRCVFPAHTLRLPVASGNHPQQAPRNRSACLHTNKSRFSVVGLET